MGSGFLNVFRYKDTQGAIREENTPSQLRKVIYLADKQNKQCTEPLQSLPEEKDSNWRWEGY